MRFLNFLIRLINESLRFLLSVETCQVTNVFHTMLGKQNYIHICFSNHFVSQKQLCLHTIILCYFFCNKCMVVHLRSLFQIRVYKCCMKYICCSTVQRELRPGTVMLVVQGLSSKKRNSVFNYEYFFHLLYKDKR